MTVDGERDLEQAEQERDAALDEVSRLQQRLRLAQEREAQKEGHYVALIARQDRRMGDLQKRIEFITREYEALEKQLAALREER